MSRPKGVIETRPRKVKKSWKSLIETVLHVSQRHYTREVLAKMAIEDQWRFMEKIAQPLMQRHQAAELLRSAGGLQPDLPLLFYDAGPVEPVQAGAIDGGELMPRSDG